MNETKTLNRSLYSIFCIILVFLGLCYFVLSYIAKDNSYSNTIYQYFHISKTFHLKLAFQNISKITLVNLINSSIIVFFIANYYFLYQNFDISHKKIKFWILGITIWAIEFIFTSTYFYQFVYLAMVDNFISASLLRRIDIILIRSFRVVNFLFWAQGIFFYFRSKNTYSSIKELRIIVFLLGILNVFIFILFVFMFGFFPQRLIWVSKVASFTMCIPLKMPIFLNFMETIPVFIFIILCAIFFLFIRYIKTVAKINADTYIFENIISSSNISIKSFAHYIKNELLGIISDLNMIKENPESQNSDIDNIVNNCRTIYEHLNLLQKNTKKIILQQQLIDIIDIVNKFLDKHKTFYEKNNITITTIIPNKNIYIFGDEFYLTETLTNITLNSCEALNESFVKNKTITYEIYNTDNIVEINIIDNGPGIYHEDITKVFEPFVSTKVTRKNWGIGLSFVKRIINIHYGTISLENVNPGLKASIKLPIVKKSSFNNIKRL